MSNSRKILAAVLSIGLIMTTACGNTENESESLPTDSSAEVIENVTENDTEAEITENESIADGENTTKEAAPEKDEESESASEEKILIAYFSNPQTDGVDANSSASRKIDDNGDVVGNVQYTASFIQKQVGGDLFRIETVEGYPADYNDTTDKAKDEQNANARPELTNHLDDVSQYEKVYIGFPNWWGDMPMAVYSFFDEYDFSGAEINVFVLHGGSRASGTVSTIRSLEPDATVNDDPLTLYWNEISDAETLVENWLN